MFPVKQRETNLTDPAPKTQLDIAALRAALHFATEEEAEECAAIAHQSDLEDNGQFGVGA